MIVTRHYLDQISSVAVAAGGSPLPSSFVCSPGIYTVGGTAYDMRDPGLYFFTDPAANSSGRRVVTGADPLHHASAFSCAARHGGRDNSASGAGLDATAKNRYVSLTCDPVSTWMASSVNSAWAPGRAARVVRFLTMETPWPNDSSHVAVEVLRGGQWQLMDPDFGRYYVDASGKVLSCKEFVDAAPAWNLSVRLLTPFTDKSDTALGAAGSFDYATYGAAVFGDDAGKQAWTQRVCQAVGIDATDGKTYWLLPVGSAARKAWVESLDPRWKVDTDPAVWNARFY